MHNLVLIYGDKTARYHENGQINKIPATSAVGIITQKQQYILKGNVYFISVRFKPLGFYRFFKLSPREIVDKNVYIGGENTFMNEIYHKVGETTNHEVIIKHLNTYFLRKYSNLKYLDRILRPLQYGIGQISKSTGNISLHDICNQLNISERHYRKMFKDYIGISPKLFIRIHRFNYAMQALLNNPDFSVHDVVYTAGFFDQAHFNKDFKFFTNNTLSNFESNFKEFDELHRKPAHHHRFQTNEFTKT